MEIDSFRVQTAYDILEIAVRGRRAELNQAIAKASGRKVQGGVFAELILPEEPPWADRDLPAKILGCYEEELAPALLRMVAKSPRVVVNVGCAEGYYAVGLARLLPQAQVVAYDIASDARAICRKAAEINGVSERVVIKEACTQASLNADLAIPGPRLLVMDIEGGERMLLDPCPVPELCNTDIIVECHDFVDREITDILVQRFSPTHEIETVMEAGRNPNAYKTLRHLPAMDRWLMMSERRPETMHWLVCSPRHVD